MTRLEDLIYSLATVLVRYHDSQGLTVNLIDEPNESLKTLKSRKLAISIVTSDSLKFEDKLKELISNCTIKYPDRQHFLTYILNELIVLKEFHDSNTVMDHNSLLQYKSLVFQMINQFKQLLLIKKNETTAIKYSALPGNNGADITLNGLINTAYVGSYFCNSGILLLTEVLNRLNLSDKSLVEELECAAQDIITEHQNALLAKKTFELTNQLLSCHETMDQMKKQHLEEIKSQIDQLTGYKSLVTKIQDDLNKALEENKLLKADSITSKDSTKQELNENLACIKSLTEEITRYKSLITKLESDLGRSREENSALRHGGILAEKDRTIKELEKKISSLNTELEQLQNITPRLTTTGVFTPMLFGTARFPRGPSFTESSQQNPKL